MSVQVYVNLHLFSNAKKKQNSENKFPESHSQSLPAPMFVMWNETGKTVYTLKRISNWPIYQIMILCDVFN